MTASIAQRATSAQVDYLKSLLAQLEFAGRDMSGTRQSMNAAWTACQFDRRFASDMISVLRVEVEKLVARTPKVPDGRYAVKTDEGHYAFYRVWNGKRATLVYLMISDDEMWLGREVARTILAKITSVGPLEASKAYGSQIGACGVCGRTLTNPTSISNGIGPVCAGKF